MKHTNLAGQVFGKLTVLGVERSADGLKARVACECGSEPKSTLFKNLRAGLTKSCGCLRVGNPKHGMHKTKEYKAWQNMLTRVATREFYKSLGVCERWRDFQAFYEDMGDMPFEGATLERSDNSKGYSKENCVWATREQQQANRRNTLKLSVNGVEKAVTVWARETGLDVNLIKSRLKAGILGERALELGRLPPTFADGKRPGKDRRLFSNGEEQLNMVQLAKRLGLAKATVSWRANNKKDLGGFFELKPEV